VLRMLVLIDWHRDAAAAFSCTLDDFCFCFVQLKSPYYYYLYSPSCTRFIYPILTHQSSDLLLGASNCEQLVLYTQACAKIEGGKDKKKEREKSEYMFVAIYTKRQEKKKKKTKNSEVNLPTE